MVDENRTEGCTTNAINWAVKNGHLEVVKFLHKNRTEGCTADAMNYAAENGYL
jgi:peroxiredoxin